MDYELGEFTAAATFYLAEIYAHFSQALMTSERPEGLSPLEREQYELAIEEQAYPFEEKAITVHESNLKLISRGVYNPWIEKSLQKLAVFVPARYAKPEETSGAIGSLETYVFEIGGPAATALPMSDTGDEPADAARVEETGAAGKTEPAEPAPVQQPAAAAPDRSARHSGDPGVAPGAVVQ
jgi:hypothetical protein